jgi:hypothetical protein
MHGRKFCATSFAYKCMVCVCKQLSATLGSLGYTQDIRLSLKSQVPVHGLTLPNISVRGGPFLAGRSKLSDFTAINERSVSY